MIPRYALEPMADLFTDEARYRTWLEVEILAVEAWAKLGVVPAADAAAVRERARVDAGRGRGARAGHRPRRRRLRRRRPGGASARPAGAWVHYGLTSSDVVDTALSRHPRRGPATSCSPAVGRARGRHRRPGPRVPGHADGRSDPRDPRRADHVRGQARALGAAGPPRPGAPGPGPGRRSRSASSRARSAPTPTSTPRSRRSCASTSASPRCRPPRCSPATATPSCCTRARRSARRIEAFALEIRHLQRTEVRRGRGAVPHRRAEGLERDAAQAQPGEERAAVRSRPRPAGQPAGRARRRRALARARHLALVGRAHHPSRLAAARVLRRREVHARSSTAWSSTPTACCENLDASYGLVFSQPVLLALVEAGLTRDDAYRIVQRDAMRTWEERRPFLDVLAEDADVDRGARRRARSTPAST